MSDEIWKDIPDYEELYQVSNLGNVRSKKRSKNLKKRLDRYGYFRVVLYRKNERSKSKLIHRLVALAFLENKTNKPQVDHINTIRTDNRVENLRWVTYKENNLNPITMEKYRNKPPQVYSAETRNKMSESAKKRVRSHASEETKHRQSIARKKWWDKHKQERMS